MLLNIHIKNIAIIDEIDVGFEEHLNIMTGETGAGKSIIIGSIGIGLGGKFSKELLRNEDEDGLVELLFSVEHEYIREQLEVLGIDVGDDNEIVFSRRLSFSGRCVNRINDTTVTTAKLKEAASIMIDLHAQHEQQTLLRPAKHMEILDRFGRDELAEYKDNVASLYKSYRELEDELGAQAMDSADKVKRMEFLLYQINEIQSAQLKDGEDVQLEKAYRLAVNSKEILSVADEVYRVTGYGTADSCADRIGHALGQMRNILKLDEGLEDIHNILQDVDGMLNDFNRELSRYMKDMEFDAREFTDMENRLNLINSLKAKYGNSIGDVLQSCENLKNEYEKLLSYDEYISGIKAEYDRVGSLLAAACDELTECRIKTADRLCKMIKQSLMELNFSAVEFDMKFEKTESYSLNGNDEAVFVISTNIGEPVRPLNEIASGGELSRVMLAIKSCLAYEDDTPTLVFDEIDVGISGRTAQKVAEKISIIGRNHQVICITHLPQIAAMADTHYIIEKNVENNKTISNIRKLKREQEIDEIARLLGGAQITEATILNAREMKGLADRTKIY